MAVSKGGYVAGMAGPDNFSSVRAAFTSPITLANTIRETSLGTDLDSIISVLKDTNEMAKGPDQLNTVIALYDEATDPDEKLRIARLVAFHLRLDAERLAPIVVLAGSALIYSGGTKRFQESKKLLTEVAATLKTIQPEALPSPIVDNNAQIEVFLKSLPSLSSSRSEQEGRKLDQIILDKLPFFFALYPTVDQFRQLEKHVHWADAVFAVKRAAIAQKGFIKTPDDFLKIASNPWWFGGISITGYVDYEIHESAFIYGNIEFFLGLHPTPEQINKLALRHVSTESSLLFEARFHGFIK